MLTQTTVIVIISIILIFVLLMDKHTNTVDYFISTVVDANTTNTDPSTTSGIIKITKCHEIPKYYKYTDYDKYAIPVRDGLSKFDNHCKEEHGRNYGLKYIEYEMCDKGYGRGICSNNFFRGYPIIGGDYANSTRNASIDRDIFRTTECNTKKNVKNQCYNSDKWEGSTLRISPYCKPRDYIATCEL